MVSNESLGFVADFAVAFSSAAKYFCECRKRLQIGEVSRSRSAPWIMANPSRKSEARFLLLLEGAVGNS